MTDNNSRHGDGGFHTSRVIPDVDAMLDSVESCNTCGSALDIDVPRQTLKNRAFLATLNEKGEVLRECCELCAQEIEDHE